MSSASRATNRSQLTPAKQHGRLASLIFTYLPICLVPMLLLGGLVFWVVRAFIFKIAPSDQATVMTTQFGLVVLVAVLLTAVLTLVVSLRASRRLSGPLPELVAGVKNFLAGTGAAPGASQERLRGELVSWWSRSTSWPMITVRSTTACHAASAQKTCR
jgi:hypothetical protein